MLITVHAVGRMKAGPEKELAARYFERFARTGAKLGLSLAPVQETPESRAGTAAARRRAESAKLDALMRDGAVLCVLDERGKSRTSEGFADMIAALREEGCRHLVLAIGGPDGHDPALARRARMVLSFGAQTWPHQLVRIMLAEQLYRAATVLDGHPYHRA